MSTAAWARQAEGGNPLLLRLCLRLLLRLGAPLGAALLLPPVTAWYLLAAGQARAASRDFLRRALGRRPSAGDVARHLHGFAAAVLERVFLLTGRTERFSITVEGLDHMEAQLRQGRGCILLGAHLGSFEALRAIGRQAPVAVRPVMYRRNAGALTSLLDSLAVGLSEAVIDLGQPGSMLLVGEAIERGEIVGLLADRTPRGERTITVPFLGTPAAFPAGPFILAGSLGAPVLLAFGLRTGPRRYIVRFQPFADRLDIRRTQRAADLESWVTRYAAALEQACRAHPLNWFNFYPFWAEARRA